MKYALLALALLTTSVEAKPVLRGGVFCNELAQIQEVFKNVQVMPFNFALQMQNTPKIVCVLHRPNSVIVDDAKLHAKTKAVNKTYYVYEGNLVGLYNSDGSVTEVTPPIVQFFIADVPLKPGDDVGDI